MKRHMPQEIIGTLGGAETELSRGATIEAVRRKLEISEQGFQSEYQVPFMCSK
jgi:hypothetical protein